MGYGTPCMAGASKDVAPGTTAKHLFLAVLVFDDFNLIRTYQDAIVGIGERPCCVER